MPRYVRFVLPRLASIVLVMWGAATLAFLTLRLTPGDPVDTVLGAASTASPAVREQIRVELGLDQPVLVQYLTYLGRLLDGDLGTSYQLGRPVADVLASQLAPTLQLAGVAAALGIVLAVATALLTAGRRTRLRSVSLAVELIIVSSPGFWIGILLLTVFSFQLDLFPVSGARDWTALVLPAITMALPVAAILTQVLRGGMEGALREPFTVSARARGLAEASILRRHALRHGAIPAVTLTGFVVGSLLSGAVVAETVFGRPGLGRVALTAITSKDIPVVMGVVLISAFAFVVINLIVDLLYLVIDPRLRVS
ncbi:ABC transporter permease [Georgenia sp. TF02-10]|uniref:ABC transporter permease n=1 Tax=Georgenia sp. TF02-10 TaxID=2917725 RepID=UPI001FA73AA3|nr:ABC transporter permease [Georgenia sp. TF02-10]UNX53808.1 ABC transporter permease [Georgenia sp. TF02-10]